MRTLLCATLLAIGCFAAGNPEDTRAIWRTVDGLNRQPVVSETFTDDSDAPAKLAELYKTMRVEYQIRSATLTGPKVVISHEPWGEAQIMMPELALEIRTPRVVCGAIRYVTDDVAVVDASFVVWRGEIRRRTPLVLVMKKEDELWKIASLRVLAEP
jgi:hypothetical protein